MQRVRQWPPETSSDQDSWPPEPNAQSGDMPDASTHGGETPIEIMRAAAAGPIAGGGLVGIGISFMLTKQREHEVVDLTRGGTAELSGKVGSLCQDRQFPLHNSSVLF